MKKIVPLLLTTLVLSSVALAQEPQKPLSPPAKAEATIGGKKITIDYSAPSKRGRVIMGGLVPFDKVWRTGANAATTLVTESSLMIGSVHVPAGTYTLYTLPGEKEWTLIINKQNGQWGTEYNAAQDLGRTKMTVKPIKNTVETFVIAIKPVTDKTGVLTLTWENTEASVPLMLH
jgi:hypothetical protein